MSLARHRPDHVVVLLTSCQWRRIKPKSPFEPDGLCGPGAGRPPPPSPGPPCPPRATSCCSSSAPCPSQPRACALTVPRPGTAPTWSQGSLGLSPVPRLWRFQRGPLWAPRLAQPSSPSVVCPGSVLLLRASHSPTLRFAFACFPFEAAHRGPDHPPPALGPGTWHVGGPGQARAAGRPAPCSHVAVLSRSPLPLGMWRGSAHAPWGVCTCPTAHGKCESLSAWNRAPKSTVSRSLSLVGPGHPECWAGRGTQNLGRGLWPPGVSLQRLELPCVGPGVEEGRVAGAPGRGLGPPSRELQT